VVCVCVSGGGVALSVSVCSSQIGDRMIVLHRVVSLRGTG
jgi:hypothetical protein